MYLQIYQPLEEYFLLASMSVTPENTTLWGPASLSCLRWGNSTNPGSVLIYLWESCLYLSVGVLLVFVCESPACIWQWESYLYLTVGVLLVFVCESPACIWQWESCLYLSVRVLLVFCLWESCLYLSVGVLLVFVCGSPACIWLWEFCFYLAFLWDFRVFTLFCTGFAQEKWKPRSVVCQPKSIQKTAALHHASCCKAWQNSNPTNPIFREPTLLI